MSTNMDRPDLNPARDNGFRGVDWTPTVTGAVSFKTAPLAKQPAEPDGAVPGLTTETECTEKPAPPATKQASHTWPSTVSNFSLVEKVHEGRMSVVWRAIDDTQNTVAVKLVPRDLVPTTDAQTLDWLSEVSEHPALLKLIEHGISNPWWYQVAEWVEGETLDARRQAAGLRTARLLPVWMKQIGAALDTLHLAGFIHGDVKPSNILLVDGKARLIDLMGVRIGASWYKEGGLTPAFASPEARNGGPADPRDDVYSLAATIFLLLKGELADHTAIADRTSSPPAGLTSFQWHALQNALNPNREQRTPSVVEFVDAMWPVSAQPQAAVQSPLESSVGSITSLFSARRSHSQLYNVVQHWSSAARVAVGAGMAIAQNRLRNAPPAAASTANAFVRRLSFRRRNVVRRWSIAASVAVAAWMASVNNSPSIAPSVATSAVSAVASPTPIAVSDARPAQLPEPTIAVAASKKRVREPAAHAIESKHVNELAKAVPVVQPVIEPAEDVVAVQSHSVVSTPTPSTDASIVPPIATGAGANADRTRPGMLPVRFSPPDRPVRLNMPPRPEVPVVPVVPEIPSVPSRPDLPAPPNRPDVPIVPTRPEVPVIPTRPEVPVIPVIPEVPSRPDIPVVPVRPDIPVIPERPNRPDRPERPSRPDKPDRPDKPEKPEKP